MSEESDSVRVFVYGALRKGASHAWRMDAAKWLGAATVQGTLVKVDWYPGLVLAGTTEVQGEVYEVNATTLRELDEFEGIGVEDNSNSEYERVSAQATMADGEVLACQIYEWQLGIADYPIVSNGDWLTVQP